MLLLFSIVFWGFVSTETLNELIYTKIDFGDTICFRMNNFKGQIGCQTGRDGDSGVLFPVQKEEGLSEDLQGLGMPIIAVLDASLFTNETVTALKGYPDTKGILIMEEDMVAQSMEKTCPGNGFNIGEKASSIVGRECLDSHKWNPDGNWLIYYDLPFGVSLIKGGEREKVWTRALKNLDNNGTLIQSRRWGGEIKTFMNSAKDTKTCLRRGTCDPIGGLSTHVQFTPRLSQSKPIILLITKADASAFFKDLSYGGYASAASLAVLLGVIDALANVRDNDQSNDFTALDSELMVSFLQAESWDYSGSQRLAYDLKNGRFGTEAYNISISDVKLIIEIGPVSIANLMYLHTYNADATVTDVRSSFTNSSDLLFTSRDTLPPSSLHSFYREQADISGLLITDTDTALLSSLYGSRFDTLDPSASPNLVDRLTRLAGVVAGAALRAAGGNDTTNATTDSSLMEEVLECVAVTQNCSLIQGILNSTDLSENRLSRYASVSTSATSNATIYLNAMSLFLSKAPLPDTNFTFCNASFTGHWDPFPFNGSCFGTIVNHTTARSPAFLLKEYESDQYSTWTESRWSASYSLRLFILPNQSENTAVFVAGLVYFLVVSGVIWQCWRQRSHIFPDPTPQPET